MHMNEQDFVQHVRSRSSYFCARARASSAHSPIQVRFERLFQHLLYSGNEEQVSARGEVQK